ncbi:MAG: hypothetical protein H6685_00930 [Deltaproteobacteria bacterium]|nr:hypothetical protein [Deltaproteobacteria bacterium]
MPPSSKARRAVLVAMAVVVGLGAVELAARLVDARFPSRPTSPLEFQQIPDALFPLQSTLGGPRVYRTAGLTQSFQAVPATRVPGEVRIGVLGESAVAGLGISPPWTFTGWMQRFLTSDDRPARVVNLGRIGYASAQLRRVAAEALATMDLDWLVIYVGNNEYLEANARLSAGEMPSASARRLRAMLYGFATTRLMQRLLPRNDRVGELPPGSSDAPLPDDVRRRILDEFQRNMTAIVRNARAKGATPVLALPAVNMRYSPTRRELDLLESYPENLAEQIDRYRLSRHFEDPAKADEALSNLIASSDGEARTAFEVYRALDHPKDDASLQFLVTLYSRLSAMLPTDLTHQQVLMFAVACAALDRESDFAPAREAFFRNVEPETSYSAYYAARLAEIFGRDEEAAEFFAKARDLDPKRIRADSDILAALRQVAEREEVDLVDTPAALRRFTPSSGPGFGVFLDYCHFNAVGHLLLGDILANAVDPERASASSDFLPKMKAYLASLDRDGTELSTWLGFNDKPTRLVDEFPVALSELDTDVTPATDQGRTWAALLRIFTYAGANEMEYRNIMNQLGDGPARNDAGCLLEGLKCHGPGFFNPSPSF